METPALAAAARGPQPGAGTELLGDPPFALQFAGFGQVDSVHWPAAFAAVLKLTLAERSNHPSAMFTTE